MCGGAWKKKSEKRNYSTIQINCATETRLHIDKSNSQFPSLIIKLGGYDGGALYMAVDTTDMAVPMMYGSSLWH